MVDGDNSKPNLGRVIDYFDESARDLRIRPEEQLDSAVCKE